MFIEAIVEIPHNRLEFAANFADGFLDDFDVSLFVFEAVSLDELARLIEKLLLLFYEIHTVASLVEASVAGITIKNVIFMSLKVQKQILQSLRTETLFFLS